MFVTLPQVADQVRDALVASTAAADAADKRAAAAERRAAAADADVQALRAAVDSLQKRVKKTEFDAAQTMQTLEHNWWVCVCICVYVCVYQAQS